MSYEKCRDCKYRCTCCNSRADGMKCSGCENHSVSPELEAFCNKCEKYDVCDKMSKKVGYEDN